MINDGKTSVILQMSESAELLPGDVYSRGNYILFHKKYRYVNLLQSLFRQEEYNPWNTKELKFFVTKDSNSHITSG